MATDLVLFDCFALDLIMGKHNFDEDTFQIALTNTQPNTTSDTVYGDLDEITAENGYTAGGTVATLAPNADDEEAFVSGITVTFTASGGSFGPLQYAVLYNLSSDALIGYWEYPSSITLNDTEQLTIVYTAGEVLRLVHGA